MAQENEAADVSKITEDDAEEYLEALKGQNPDLGYPKPPERESVFKFFKHLIGLSDSSKVGNLSKAELGTPELSVRSWQKIALYAEAEGLPLVAEYLRQNGEIILASSASFKGFYPQLFVTQIKREQKLKQPEEKKGTWFGGNKNKPEDQRGEGI